MKNKSKKPLCGHTDGFCSYDVCRMNYAIKTPKGKLPPIDKYLHHREKVVKRIREIELQKLDNDLFLADQNLNKAQKEFYLFVRDELNRGTIPIGEFRKRKEQSAKYRKMFWKVLLGFMLIVISYPILIAIIDLL